MARRGNSYLRFYYSPAGIAGLISIITFCTAQLAAAQGNSPVSADGTQEPTVEAVLSNADPAPINVMKVEFELGVSSNTVERLAKQNSCKSDFGAGLLAKSGPVEVYRVSCQNGWVFTAKCVMRQCAQM